MAPKLLNGSFRSGNTRRPRAALDRPQEPLLLARRQGARAYALSVVALNREHYWQEVLRNALVLPIAFLNYATGILRSRSYGDLLRSNPLILSLRRS